MVMARNIDTLFISWFSSNKILEESLCPANFCTIPLYVNLNSFSFQTISIPSLPKPGACLEENRDGGESTRSFSFNISDTVSDSGPQGSFEVLQSTKSG